MGWVKIKLFNLLVGKLGPIFLRTGTTAKLVKEILDATEMETEFISV